MHTLARDLSYSAGGRSASASELQRQFYERRNASGSNLAYDCIALMAVSRIAFSATLNDWSWSSLGTPLVEFAATQLTFGLLEPMSGIGRAI